MPFVNVDREMNALQQEIDKFKQECVEQVKTAARVVTEEFMARTPVWSGRTVRNYQWGVGGAPGGGELEPEGGEPPASGKARESDPGRTGLMALGAEPRRAANESAALQDMESVLSGLTELKPLVMTNNSRIWDEVDNGSAPTAERARNPGGVSVLGEQSAKASLGGTFK